MDYSGTFNLTFKNWWKFKKYWLIGFIALFNPFLFTILGMFILGQNTHFGTNAVPCPTCGVPLSDNETQFMGIVAVVFMVTLILYLLYVLTIGNIFITGLIKAYAVSNETGRILGIIEVFKLGAKYWIKLIAQKLLIVSPILVAITIFSILVTFVTFIPGNSSTQAGSSIFLVGICCFEVVIFVMAFFIQVINEISARYLILEDQGILGSLKSGFKFVKNNISIAMVAILMLLLLAMVIYAIIIIPSIVVVIILAAGILTTTSLINSQLVLATVIFLVTSSIASLLYIFLLSLSVNLQISYWNTLFIKFKEFKTKLVSSN